MHISIKHRHRVGHRRAGALAALVALLAAGGALSACGSGGSGASAGGGGGVTLGFIVDKTGPLAPIGNGYARGVEVATDQWNATPGNPKVKVDSCDSQSTGDGAIACYQKLRNSVDAISGPSLFVGLASVRSLASKGTVPLVSGAPLVDPPAGSPMFQTIPTIPDGIGAAFNYFRHHGLKRVALLTSNDEPGNLAKNGAAQLAGKYGITLVAREVFDPQAQNLAAQAENIAAAKPDAVLAWTAGPQLITALRALQAARVDVPVMLNYASMSTQLLAAAGAGATGNVLFFGTRAFDPGSIDEAGWRSRVEDFDKRFQAKFKQAPDLTAVDSGDTVFVVGAAAKKGADPHTIQSQLESGRDLPALMFPSYRFTKDRHIGVTGPQVFDILRWLPAARKWKLVK